MSNSRPFLLAIDVGTSSLKAVLYNRTGRTLDFAGKRYGYTTPQPGWAEADPNDWWNALVDALEEMRARRAGLEQVEIIALTGQMHTGVLLDEHGEPLSPTILWLDRRAAAETLALQQRLGLPPYQLNSTYTLPKLAWMAKHRPQTLQQTRTLMWPKDYLRYRLTGRIATDYTEAGGASLLDWERRTWAPQRLIDLGIDPGILPPIFTPETDAGPLLPAIAHQLGLNPQARIITGAGDVRALISAAPLAPGRVSCSLGSSSMVFAPLLSGQVLEDPQHRLYTYPLLPYPMLGGVSSTTGAALQWAWQAFCCNETFDEAIQGALGTPPGAEGAFFLPFLSGERSPFWSDALRGGFYGLGLAQGRYHLLRAVMEGVAFSLRYLLDVFAELHVDIHEIALSAGGAQTPGWAQMIADVCQKTVLVYSGRETVTHSLYAYACTVAAPGEPFEEALLRTFDRPQQCTPDPQTAGVYQPIYERYVRLSQFVHQALV
ncbi:MAG: FGGY family carbohydrate kinase [Anaerolineaceae bacterium]|nr:FGGY family carbohydrate kinase [Anaerolineaceae bacterium]